jgi:hypothetical protein
MQGRDNNGTDMASPLLFREVQHFRMWMFWVPIVVVVGVVWYEFFQQVVRDNPSGTQPLPDWAAWVLAIVFGLGLPVAGYLLRLITEVHVGDIYLHVFPFRGSHVALKDVVEAEVREYSGQREYGGWGVRTTAKAGKAYTAWGTKGMQLWLNEDERILIGTQKPKELTDVLRKAGVFVR